MTERPWTVTAGCALNGVIFVWDVISAVSDEELVEMSPWLTALLLAIGLIPMGFTVAAYFRRNWGRIALAILTALGVLAIPFLMQLGPEAAPIDAETLLYSIAGVTAVVLLFVPASNAWYRNRFAAETVRP